MADSVYNNTGIGKWKYAIYRRDHPLATEADDGGERGAGGVEEGARAEGDDEGRRDEEHAEGGDEAPLDGRRVVAVLQERLAIRRRRRRGRRRRLPGERPDVEREHVAQAQEAGRSHRREQRRFRNLVDGWVILGFEGNSLKV